jgi:hypothetical protein
LRPIDGFQQRPELVPRLHPRFIDRPHILNVLGKAGLP